MLKGIKYLFIFLLLLLSTAANAFFVNDTLYICQGQSIQLETDPNGFSYAWSANENINDTTIYNPIVSPTVTTTYYVFVEPDDTSNLVMNGDFSDGNVGFSSDYILTTVSTTAQGHYGIFTSPTQFNGGFGNCNDHTDTNDELMMVVDGATTINEDVWCQTVNVIPDRSYQFSAWITNVFHADPALLQFSINGILLGEQFDVEEDQCDWKEFAESWYSGSNTMATICITNQNTIAFGNDFAFDDISFMISGNSYIDTFTVVVLENAETNIDTTICANDFIVFDGTIIPADSLLVFNYTAWNGCDSLVNVNVMAIDTSYTEMRVDTLCPGDTIYHMGFPITVDTSICEIYTNTLGCDSSICFVAYFLSEATIAIDAVEPSCTGDLDGSLVANPFAGLPPYEYLWNTGSTENIIANLSAGTYLLTVTDVKNCIAEKTIVLLEPSPLAFEYTTEIPSCFGFEDGQITFLPAGGTPDYWFTFNEQTTNQETIINDLADGTYALQIEDENQCMLDTFVTLEEPSPITINLPADTSLQLGCFLDIDAQIIASYDYNVQWIPTVTLDCPTCDAPRAFPFDDVVYEIQVTDAVGCEAHDALKVSLVKNYEVYIPNAFSPNRDGVNDFFEIYCGKGVEEIVSFSVFNRWGALIFETNNFLPNDRNSRWDGNFNGEALAPAVFIYLAKVRFIDGEEKIFSGDISLIK